MKTLAIFGISLVAAAGHAYGKATQSKGKEQIFWAAICFFEAMFGVFLIEAFHIYL